MTDDVCEVIITAPDPEWVATFTRSLVVDRLCASGHNIAPIRSIYRWQGTVYDRTEARVALHTRAELVPEITDRTNRDHPCAVPCVIAVPITTGILYMSNGSGKKRGNPEPNSHTSRSLDA